MEGHYDIVKFLLDQGSVTDFKNNKYKTSLIISLQYGRTKVVQHLLSRGVSVLSRDVSGASVLAHAKELRE
jgi:ankyrin repeat protein